MDRGQALRFSAFCLLSGSRWLVDEAFPSVLPPLAVESLHFLIVGAAAGAFLLLQRKTVRGPSLRIAAASLLLLGVPSLLNALAHSVPLGTRAALFAVTPLLVILGTNAGAAGSPDGQAQMPWALMGLAGAALLLPFTFPETGRGFLLFGVVILACAATAAGSVWLHTLLRGCGTAHGVGVVCAANALLVGSAALMTGLVGPTLRVWGREVLRGIALDLPLLWLLVWLLREMDPIRFSARFPVALLVSVLEGILLLHPALDLRMAVGLILMVAGSGALLLGKAGNP